MAKAKRVHQIAKEIGVSSKTVLEKCRAEGVDIKNHMSTVSVGLEVSILEWFSEQEESPAATAVEVSDHVEVNPVKATARKKAKKKPTEEPEAEVEAPAAPEAEPEKPAAEVEESEEAEEEVEAPRPTRAKAKPKPKPAPEPEPEVEEEAEEEEAEEAAPVAEAPTEAEAEVAAEGEAEEAEAEAEAEQEPAEAVAEAEGEGVAEAPAGEQGETGEAAEAEAEAQEVEAAEGEGKPKAMPNVPKRPEQIGPAGPQLEKPTAAKLRGPKVVRVEEPEPVRKPRGRRSTYGGPGTQEPADVIRSRGPARGRGAGVKPTEPAEDDRSRSPRRKRRKKGRTGDSDTWRRDTFSEQDLIEREERLSRAGGFLRQRRQDMRKASHGGGPADTPVKVGGKVEIAEPITIKDLSAATGIKGAEIVKYLFNQGVMATINDTLETDAAVEIALEYDIELVVKAAKSAEQEIERSLEERDRDDVQRRPPIVAVLGHVDHGKTSLLDKIREADVVAGESGGITQHIGAYRASIETTEGEAKTVVFLDTPGHEAFTAMRARGATLTDVVVLVVAADDGVMPQTVESINHAKAAGVSIVVALNKIDMPQATDANVQRILGQLAEHELNPVEWGGETEVVRTSAETGEGIAELVEILDFRAELLELSADYAGPAYGQVIEAELDPGRGAVARVLVQEGQMRVGDFVVMGRAFGRVRDMIDDRGRSIEIAGPVTPVEISGIDEVPDAGDKFYVTGSLRQAEDVAEQRRDLERKHELADKSKVTLDNVFAQMQASQTKELRVVVKADVQGSIEVLRKTVEDIGKDNEEVTVRVLHAAVGGITESDVLLAEASNAVIIGFHVIADAHARQEAETRGVDVRIYRVIYDVVDDVTRALEGMLSPEQREEVLGHAEVRDVFRVSRVGAVAGCYVTDGVVRRNAMIRVTRGGIVIEHDRTLESLKRFKDDAREVRSGMECGMKIEGYDDIEVGDVLECYVQSEVQATLG